MSRNMTHIEILHALNGDIQNPFPWTKKEQNDAIDAAEEAMEKQEAKEVEEIHLDDFICPNCYEEDSTVDYRKVPKYCRNCGQKLSQPN